MITVTDRDYLPLPVDLDLPAELPPSYQPPEGESFKSALAQDLAENLWLQLYARCLSSGL